jgi:nucleoside-diphosphate-sugar epimerase
MMVSLLAELLVVGVPLLVAALVVDYRMNAYYREKIPHLKLPSSSTGNDTHSKGHPPPKLKTERSYVITGGSGFIGSWIARYLILRGDNNVYIVDKRPPPPDLLRHGGIFIEVDLAAEDSRSKLLRGLRTKGRNLVCSDPSKESDGNNDSDQSESESESDSSDSSDDSTATLDLLGSLTVFHCAVTARHHARKASDGISSAGDNVKMARNVVHSLSGPDCIFIVLSDTIISQHPITLRRWWSGWLQFTSSHTEKFVSPYAESMFLSEMEFLSHSKAVACSLHVHGFVSGHIGDHFLAPALSYNGGLLHSWGVPISLIHVEDVARAALLAESKQVDSRENCNYVIANPEITTLAMVFNYIRSRRPFAIIKIRPIIVLAVSMVVSLVSSLFEAVGFPVAATRKQDSLLIGSGRTLTMGRFNVLQVASLVSAASVRQAKADIGFEAEWAIAEILDGIIEEEESRKTATGVN